MSEAAAQSLLTTGAALKALLGAGSPPDINTSGFRPLDVRVLVRPDEVQKKTAGGIHLPEQHTEREEYAQIKATLVAAGVNAWAEASENPDFEAPQPGARVLIAKYGGIVIEGQDGQKYRIMNDADITAVIEEN